MNLLLNLGHNSAAIAVAGSHVIGYEQERLSRVKSDSSFPSLAIKEIYKTMASDLDATNFADYKPDTIYVSHWFDNYNFHKAPSQKIRKYWDADAIECLKAGGFKNVIYLGSGLTHHDAHAWSGLAFYENHTDESPVDYHVIVADGFGNHQEVFSVYKISGTKDNARPYLIHRAYGYKRSLGLMYQFATSFCGMKENQDEYKFLGYETNLFKGGADKIKISLINDMAVGFGHRMFNSIISSEVPDYDDGYINVEALQKTKAYFHGVFHDVVNAATNYTGHGTETKRGIVGYFIQTVVETCYKLVLQHYHVKNVILAGGIHYNVKLNNIVNERTDRICVCPLAGDQGAGIGLYRAHGHKFPFKDLTWGRRTFTDLEPFDNDRNISVCKSKDEYVAKVVALLRRNKIVNTVTGDMEFGPRALCNTSTLAIGTSENVELINAMNGRDTVMPFAGVMLEGHAELFHAQKDLKSVVGSQHYMIMTFDYVMHPKWSNSFYAGIMHQYPGQDRWSGRPQVVAENSTAPIKDILTELEQDAFNAIINTSFNTHGVPIVHSGEQAMHDHTENVLYALDHSLDKPHLVIGAF